MFPLLCFLYYKRLCTARGQYNFILNFFFKKYSYTKREKESKHLAIKLCRNVIFYPYIV